VLLTSGPALISKQRTEQKLARKYRHTSANRVRKMERYLFQWKGAGEMACGEYSQAD
jgi:hypothetical protein